MTLEEAIRTQLIHYAPLAALVGARIYGVWISETATLPAVSFLRISNAPIHHRSGSHFGRVRFQFDGWAATYPETLELRKAIRGALFKWARPADPRVDATLFLDDRSNHGRICWISNALKAKSYHHL
jgi:hypothetical protein